MFLFLQKLLQTYSIFFFFCFLVLQCLEKRYGESKFYTKAGSTVIAVNPFYPHPYLYDYAAVRRYHHSGGSRYSLFYLTMCGWVGWHSMVCVCVCGWVGVGVCVCVCVSVYIYTNSVFI